MAASGFVASIAGHWFLITAGHVLEAIEQARASGQILERFRLVDGFAKAERAFPPLVFAFDDALKHHFHDDEVGVDYGFIYLRPNVQSLLEANGIVALSERAWRDDLPISFDEVVLAGIPSQFVAHRRVQDGILLRSTLAVIALEPCTQRPAGIKAQDERLIYKVPPSERESGQLLLSADGMSGCPILGVKHGSDNEHRYWVIGVQSAQLQESGKVSFVIACPFLPLAEFLNDVRMKVAGLKD